MGEVLALSKALGVDPQSSFDAVAGGPLDMGYLWAKSGLILNDQLSRPSSRWRPPPRTPA
jgi:3-hydroxyisobutyrate dehydrogenase